MDPEFESRGALCRKFEEQKKEAAI